MSADITVAIQEHGAKTEAATITLAIAVEKLAVAQMEIAKANQQLADHVGDLADTYRRRF